MRKKNRSDDYRFRQIFENSLAVMLLIDPETRRILDANYAAEKFYGWEREILCQKRIDDINTLSSDEIKIEMEKARRSERIYFNFKHRLANEQVRDVEVYSSKITVEGKDYLYSIIHDITEQKTAENALLKEKQQLSQIIDGTRAGTWEWNIQTGQININARWAEIIGYTIEELAPLTVKTWQENTHPEDLKISDDLLQQHFTGEAAYYTCELRMKHKKGHWVWVIDRGKVTSYTPDGKPLIMYGTHQEITERKEAENALLHSHYLMRYIIEHDRSGIAVFDKNLRYIYVSQRYLHEYRISQPDIIGRHHYEVFQEMPERWKKIHQQVLAGAIMNEDRDPFIRGNGETDWVRWECRPWYEADGSIGGMILYSEIVNEQIQRENEIRELNAELEEWVKQLKQKQQALAESESKYRLLAENSGDVIFVLDRNLKYTYISPAIKALRGFEPEEAMQQDIREAMTPESYERTIKTINETFTSDAVQYTGTPIQRSIEIELIRKDKSTVWAEIKASVYFDETNTPTGILGVSRDISKRRKAEEEHQKLSRAVEQSPVSIIITNPDGVIEYVNPRFIELTGFSLEEARGQRPSLVKSGFTTGEEYSRLWETITAGNEWHGEFRNKRKDGTLFWEQASISAIKNTQGQITHFLGIKEDITQKKKYEEDLIRAKEKAEESDRLKTAFLQNISHEIRTPLNAIVGFSSIIGGENLVPEKRREFMEIIQSSNDQLLSVISGIISLASLDAGQEKCSEAAVNVNEIVASIHDQLSISAIPETVDFSYQCALPDDMANIISDPVKLTQVLLNLTGNALKFTHQGQVKLGYELANKMLKFYVADTGIGIPADMHEVIFERFRQVDNSPTRRYGGTGLGLALSKGYARLLGGAIEVDSEPGKGSVFTLTIPYKPVSPEKQVTRETGRKKAVEIPTGKTILVVEDELNNFLLVNEMLLDMDLHPIHARNGLEAISLCEGDDLPDLVLMDIKMPVMDGIEARKALKESYPQLKIVAMTAYALGNDREQFLAMGFDAYLEKPMKKEALEKTLVQMLKP